MESIFNMPSVEFKIGLPTITKIDPVKTIDGLHYARLQTTSTIEMKFKQDPTEPKRSEEEEKSYNDMLMANFQTKYGKGNEFWFLQN